MKRTAVVIIHGIGEQIPMATITGFIDAVWTFDETLVDREKPDPNTGRERIQNASWSKPDDRNRSFELQLITTESDKNGRRCDFFEYYWAHRVTGTTWEQVRAWIFGLMLRNPISNVPPGVRLAWASMWLAFALFLYVSLVAALATSQDVINPVAHRLSLVYFTLQLAAWIQAWPKWLIAIVWGAVGLAIGFVLRTMVDVAGDVVRYVEARPGNIAIRQSIRENGVRLIEDLMGLDEHGNARVTPYDRIIVVGHSLGSIVGYDILTHAFGRHNTRVDPTKLKGFKQESRVRMETMIRGNLNAAEDWSVDTFRRLQDECRLELNALGNPWIVSDFVSIGSPLTHAQFLLASDEKTLEQAKRKRVLPTCPPMLEHDRKTGRLHFTYRAPEVRGEGNSHDETAPRVPHHGAVFAYTRWTNIYSRSRLLLIGDIVSGPLRRAFGLSRLGREPLCGIDDVAVLPNSEGSPLDRRSRLLTHLKYWNCEVARVKDLTQTPFHIKALRRALDLGRAR